MYIARESAWHEKGTWKQLHTDKGLSATFACPRCGTMGALQDHEISSDGQTDVSVQCTVKDCDFHDVVILQGWERDVKHDYRSLEMKKGDII